MGKSQIRIARSGLSPRFACIPVISALSAELSLSAQPKRGAVSSVSAMGFVSRTSSGEGSGSRLHSAVSTSCATSRNSSASLGKLERSSKFETPGNWRMRVMIADCSSGSSCA